MGSNTSTVSTGAFSADIPTFLLDWRRFSLAYFTRMERRGEWDDLIEKCVLFNRARSFASKAQLVMPSSELPLTQRQTTRLISTMEAIEALKNSFNCMNLCTMTHHH